MSPSAMCVKWLAVPTPPPGPCEANAASLHATAVTIGIAASKIRSRMPNDVMTISCKTSLQKIRRQSTPVLRAPAKIQRKRNRAVSRGTAFVLGCAVKPGRLHRVIRHLDQEELAMKTLIG